MQTIKIPITTAKYYDPSLDEVIEMTVGGRINKSTLTKSLKGRGCTYISHEVTVQTHIISSDDLLEFVEGLNKEEE